MKTTLIKFIVISCLLIFFISCQEEITNEGNDTASVTQLKKYPQKAIHVTAGEAWDFMVAGTDEATRGADFIRDSIWPSKSGHTLFYKTNECATTLDAMRYIYLGSILRGGSIETQRFTPIPLAVDPITISYSFPAKLVMDEIPRPSLSAMRQSIRNIMNKEGMNGKQIASFNYDMNQFSYYSQIKLVFGCNIDIAKVFNMSIDVKNDKITNRTGLVAKFVQKNFTVDMDLPWSGSMLTNPKDLSNIERYDPVYISSITYGRMGIIMVESDYEYKKLMVAVKAGLDLKIVNGQLNISKENERILAESSIRIQIISGSGTGAVKTVSGFEEFKNFILGGGEFSRDIPGDPLFYTVSYLSDNSPYYSIFKVDIKY